MKATFEVFAETTPQDIERMIGALRALGGIVAATRETLAQQIAGIEAEAKHPELPEEDLQVLYHGPTFNAAELAEQVTLIPVSLAPPVALQDLAQVFGPQSQAASASDTVDAAPLSTAPEATQAATVISPPPAASQIAPPPAQSAAVAAPPTDSPVPVDSDGLPWDARIHASTRTKVVAGTWKMKRGVSDEEVATVTAQLRTLMAIPSPSPVTLPLGAPVADTVIPPPPAASYTAADFFQWITPMCAAGKMTPADVHAIALESGLVAGIADLAKRPDLASTVRDGVQRWLDAR